MNTGGTVSASKPNIEVSRLWQNSLFPWLLAQKTLLRLIEIAMLLHV